MAFDDLIIPIEDDQPSGQILAHLGRDIWPLPENLSGEAMEIGARVITESTLRKSQEFCLRHGEKDYRVTIAKSTEGARIFLRRGFDIAGKLSQLGIPRHLMTDMRELGMPGNSGLILFAGRSGVGKTTMACTMLCEWLNTYGGLATTVEDPPEYQLQSVLKKGRVYQFEAEKKVTPDGIYFSDFAGQIVASKRMSPNYLLVGEIRRTPEAQEAISAGMAGTTAISTIHAADVKGAIIALSRTANERDLEATYHSIAEGLKAVFHIDARISPDGKRTVDIEPLLIRGDSADGIRGTIRQGKFEQLGTYIEAYRAKARRQAAEEASKAAASSTLIKSDHGCVPLC
jgi:twitching motility protein PilT